MKRYLSYWSYYTHQGMVSALTMQGVVGYFRHGGANLAQLSWLSITMLPWAAKFLWAPWCERHALPLRNNRYQGSLVLLQLGMAALIAGIGLLSPTHALGPIIISLTLLTLLSASHGIYANGITICTTDTRTRPLANVAQVGGTYLGIPLGSFVFLTIAENAGWCYGFTGIAALSLLLLIPPLLVPQPMRALPPGSARPRFSWRDLRGIHYALTLSAIYLVTIRGLMALQTVLLIDAGLSLSALGEAIVAYSTLASGIGIMIGGWATRHFGAWRCIVPIKLSFPLIAGMFAIGYPHFDTYGWIVAFGIVNVAAAIGFVALYNVLMGLARAHQPASDYALFQSIDIAVGILISIAVLRISHYIGYRPTLALLTALATLSVWPAIRLCRQLAGSATTTLSSTPHEPSLETTHG